MKISVRKTLLSAFDAYMSTPRETWVLEWAGQLVSRIEIRLRF